MSRAARTIGRWPTHRPSRTAGRHGGEPQLRPASRAAPASAQRRPSSAADSTRGHADQLSLGRRLRQPRTIISIADPARVIAVFVCLNGSTARHGPELDPRPPTRLLLLAAFVVYYLGFPLRGLRWALLLRGRVPASASATRPRSSSCRGSSTASCPAKLGDIYRAYLLKINAPVSLSRTFGTVFIERVLDLFAIAMLGPRGRLLELPRAGCRRRSSSCSALGIVVVVVARPRPAHAAQLRAPDHRRAAAAAPGPRVLRPVRGGRVLDRARARCRASSVLTGLIWTTEALRL